MDDLDRITWEDKWKRDLLVRAQQKKSRLSDILDLEPDMKMGRYFFFDAAGLHDPVPKQSYGENTPDISGSYERRRGTRQKYHWGKLYDEDQIAKVANDPRAKDKINVIAGFRRRQDNFIITAATADAIKVNADGVSETVVPFPSGQLVPNGSTGMTLGKLITAREMFDAAEVDEVEFDSNGQIVGDAHRVLALTARQVTDLLNDNKLTSADYNTVKALQAGAIGGFLGFQFRRLQGLAKDGSNYRRCLAIAKGAIGGLPDEEPAIKVSERNDKSHAPQVYLERWYGAVRKEDVKVLALDCLES